MYFLKRILIGIYVQDEAVVEANSEDEKSWDPFDNEDMDEEVVLIFCILLQLAKAFEDMQKDPEKWLERLEEEVSDSSEDNQEESEEEESEIK